jgi:pimeloyl-ACP methyl ester carboxylesterase
MSYINTMPRTARTAIAVLAAGVSVLGFASAADAKSASRTAATAKPTIVLIHGAWADGSSWAGVTARLQRAGYAVDVPPNPLRGLSSDSAYVASFLATIKGPIVLVGHSYGGSVITDAATGNPAVKALVYVNAFIPDEGETTLQLAGAKPGSALSDPSKAFNFVPYPGAIGGDVDLYVKPSVFHADFAADGSKEAADVLAAAQRPLAASALQAKSSAPAWKTIRSWAVIGTEDQVLPPAEQVVMTRRAHAETTKVEAAHLSMVSRPGAVTKVILTATAATD